MATDFTNNNTTISASGALQPKTKNTPLDIRTRVNLKADIESIPNPFVGMHIIVLQDETNDNQMTEYVVVSLKANNLGATNSKVNEVVLAKDFLGVSSGSTSGSGMTSEQVQQLNDAYAHSQTTHVQQSDIPTKTSELTNDSGFLTSVPSEYVTETELNEKGFLTEHQDISNKADKSEIPTKLSQLENDSDYATITQVNQAIDNAQLGGSQVDLTSYAKKTDLPTKTSQLTNDSGFITEHQDISDKADKSEIPTKVSDLTNDSNFISSIPEEYITETELEDKGYLTEHQDLSKYALKTEIPSVPTKTSQLTNDSGYLTSVPSEYITETELNEKGYATETYVSNKIAEAQLSGEEVDLSGYATKDELKSKANIEHTHTMSNITDLVIPDVDKAYVDTQLNTKANKSDIPNLDGYALKTDIPTVPTKVSQLQNDSNFISSIPEEYITETELEDKGYLTEHQDISKYALKTEIPSVPTKTSQLTNDNGFITTIPSEYITESELNTELSTKANKSDIPSLDGYATETYVTNKIAEAQLNGGEVDLSGYATKDELNSTIQDYTGGKKQVYLTQDEYDLLSDTDKNDTSKVYNIIDAVEQVIPADLMINDSNLLQLKDANGNAIGTGVTVSTTSGGTSYTLPIASNTVLGGIKVGSNLSIDSNGVLSATVTGTGSGMTDDEVDTVLTNVFGESYLPQVYGDIIASLSKLSINEGESKTFTVSLSQVPTRPQTIAITSNNSDVTVNPSSIDISDTNPHTITVTVAEDEGDYADETAVLTLSSPKVSNVTINVAIKDNDIEPKPCTGISLNQETVEVEVGKSKQLIATVTPEGCTDEIVWRASNENCTVDNGLVRAVNIGECIITATCGGKSATCTVTVTEGTIQDEPPMGTNIVNVEASQWVADSENTIKTILPIKVTPNATYTISKWEGIWTTVYESNADGTVGKEIANDNIDSFTFVPVTDYIIIGMWNLVPNSWGGDIKNAPSMCELTVIKTTEA